MVEAMERPRRGQGERPFGWMCDRLKGQERGKELLIRSLFDVVRVILISIDKILWTSVWWHYFHSIQQRLNSLKAFFKSYSLLCTHSNLISKSKKMCRHKFVLSIYNHYNHKQCQCRRACLHACTSGLFLSVRNRLLPPSSCQPDSGIMCTTWLPQLHFSW